MVHKIKLLIDLSITVVVEAVADLKAVGGGATVQLAAILWGSITIKPTQRTAC